MAIFSESAGLRESAEQPVSPAAGVVRTALALGTAVAVLLVAQFWPERGARGLAPAVLVEAWQIHLPHRPVPMTVAAPVRDGVQNTAEPGSAIGTGVAFGSGANAAASAEAGQAAHPGAPGGTGTAGPLLIDNAGALGPFFEQLWTLEQKSKPEVVTVLHYGDSPTTADLITGDIRQILQERFRDAGHGFNLGAKPWAWYGHRNVEMEDHGWASSQKDATGVGRMKQALYGLGGATFLGSAGAETTYTLKDAASAPQTAVDVAYLAQPSGGTLTVSADGNTLAAIDTNAKAALPAMRTVALPAGGAKQVKVACTAGTAKWFGVNFRRGDRGVVYDSLGLNGATTTVVSRTFDPAAWTEEMKEAKPGLIVINYGTNESQYAGLVGTLDAELRGAIAKAHAAAPGVPVLIMSPMDRGERAGTEIHSNAQIAKIVAIQQRVAADTHSAFFNTFAAMGGDGTMARWYAAHPRLVTADLIHPTPDGAVIVARLFADNLYAGYDGWKRAHGIGVVRVMNATETAAKKKDEADRQKTEANRKKSEAKAGGKAAKPAGASHAAPPPAEIGEPPEHDPADKTGEPTPPASSAPPE